MATVIGISGRISSGKTTLTNELARRVNCKVVSFGDYVRKLAIDKGLPLERVQLQKLGQDLVNNDLHNFCKNVIFQADRNSYRCLLIEGIRHTVVLQKINELIYPDKLFLVFIKTAEEVLLERDKTRQFSSPREIIEKDPTEIDVVSSLESFADLVIENTFEISNSCDLIIERLHLDK